MVEALILINTTTGVMDKVYREVRRLEEVRKSAMVTGPYDIIALVETEVIGDIRDSLIEKIRSIDGVKKTTTNLVIS
ncbi:hypothetical protein AKJ66_00600 [candidate division MSBL1 archaeon SCGC-AAA259E22]|uniref:Transcription regulator AsnC/Lrp ligand binding domain-containing protein n=2 Tax=candidate division MSBL1 TaxID=215777 RepID=A0A133ULY9_9EURY|nr:hypothetical protein AKJ66_00600 [candidate division MSBL1 archaeon SCGC-AAA259E22]KXA95248.1 hypothetical protein AKJ36_01175 [candidate division MSBL1 archaeon SCGC-AAA259I07]